MALSNRFFEKNMFHGAFASRWNNRPSAIWNKHLRTFTTTYFHLILTPHVPSTSGLYNIRKWCMSPIRFSCGSLGQLFSLTAESSIRSWLRRSSIPTQPKTQRASLKQGQNLLNAIRWDAYCSIIYEEEYSKRKTLPR